MSSPVLPNALQAPSIPALVRQLPRTFGDILSWARNETALRRAELAAIRENLSLAQLNWKPTEKAWSIGEVADHLLVINRAYQAAMRKRLEKSQPPAPEIQIFRSGIVGAIELWLVRSDPTKKKFPAPPNMKPKASNHVLAILDELDQALAETQALAEACNGLDLVRLKLKNAFLMGILLRFGDAFRIYVLHDARHIGQMIRVMQREGFPSA